MDFIYTLYLILISSVIVRSRTEETQKKPNILLILTDDQNDDSILHGMHPMQNTLKFLGEYGATFENAFTSSPLCCPSRSSILSGMYAHNHHTINNSVSGGCNSVHWRTNVEPFAVPVVMQKNGYETFFAGKYLNQYYGANLPLGWNSFFGLHGNSRYYNYTLRENEKNITYEDVYLTDLILNKTLNFLSGREAKFKPFFAIIAPPAAHAPFTPADRHHNAFAGIKALHTPNFNRVPKRSEKHWLVAASKVISAETLERMNVYFQHRWETLLAVDELVATVVENLNKQNELQNTYIIFTSDNGYHVGQFAQPFDKRQPYETDIRVPLIIRGPNIASGVTVSAPIALIDLAPTIFKWAQITYNVNVDGQSFDAYLKNATIYDTLLDKQYHRSILVEYWGEGNEKTYNKECPWKKEDNLAGCTLDDDCHCQDSWNNTYACVRHFRYGLDRLYCEFQDYENFVEAYDIGEDPYQMTNIVYDMLPIERALYELALANLTRCSGSSCNNIYI